MTDKYEITGFFFCPCSHSLSHICPFTHEERVNDDHVVRLTCHICRWVMKIPNPEIDCTASSGGRYTSRCEREMQDPPATTETSWTETTTTRETVANVNKCLINVSSLLDILNRPLSCSSGERSPVSHRQHMDDR